MLLSAQNISKTLGMRRLFDAVSLSVAVRDRVGLIGPNGAGKSTLLKLLAGVMGDEIGGPDSGTLTIAKGARVVYVPQQETFDDHAIARQIVVDGAVDSPASLVHDLHEAEVLADTILSRIGFDEAHSSCLAGKLSGGWRKRLAIARALASVGGEPDLLLLDEPTNHLDLEGVQWLEELLTKPAALGVSGRRTFASMFVTHDREFLENVATRVIELSRAYAQGTLAIDGNYSEFLRRKQEFLEGQARAEQALANQVRKDLAWLHRGAKARRTKAKSRIESSHGRIDDLADLKARNAAASASGAGVDFNASGRRTRKFIEARGVSAIVPGASSDSPPRTLFANVDVEFGAGDCLGLLGANGSGKTTLIRILSGERVPDAGRVRLSDPPPRVVVFSQHRREFESSTTLAEALCPVSDQVRFRGQAMHITAWSRRFLFRDEQLVQPVGSLSGGELARVHIARIMLEPADVLILDEPTNDLDIPTLEVLEEALEDFPGALVLVTHDRAMLSRLATEILWLDGRGGSRLVASLDQALAAQRAQCDEPDAGKPAPRPAAPSPEQPKKQKKLSYNEQREYDQIQDRIAEAETSVSQAEDRVNDPGVMKDHALMTEACRDLESAQALVAKLYARWEELESKVT